MEVEESTCFLCFRYSIVVCLSSMSASSSIYQTFEMAVGWQSERTSLNGSCSVDWVAVWFDFAFDVVD